MAITMTPVKIDVPADVPSSRQALYEQNMQTMTKGTGNLMLFAGDQKVEHLNDDFYGTLSSGEAIHEHDADPEHLFRIARDGVIGCFATQFGLIARYGRDYATVPYLVKLNSKSHLIKTSQRDPRSHGLGDLEGLETVEHFREVLARLRRLFNLEPEIAVRDLHPGYLSTRLAEEL